VIYTIASAGPHEVWAAVRWEGDPPGGRGSAVAHYHSLCGPAWVAAPQDPAVRYFPEVGHTVQGAFRAYWEAHGGLAQFGYPLTEEFGAGGGRAQYFERARFEWHPELPTPFQVSLGLLGREQIAERTGEPAFQSQPGPGAPGRWFAATGHTLAPEFVPAWEAQGGLAIYGYPISEVMPVIDPATGVAYRVQYCERARFEWHPGSPATVRLGRVGAEVLQQQGWPP
jgi:hypothetical protein